MILLYPEKTTDFSNNGLGALSDAIECVVEWERNGMYELSMVYPVTGIHFADIQYGRIILAKPTPQKQPQPFIIYKIETPINGRTSIYAQHVSYNLNGIPVTPFEAATADAAVKGIKTNSLAENIFTFSSDVTTQSTFKPNEPNSARKYLGGMSGSVLDQFGGEYEFDRYNVILHKQMGQDNGVTLRYGKNITDIEQETNIENTVTGVFPYYVNDDVKVYGGISYASNHASFPMENIETVDVSAEFDETPTVAQVTEAGARNLRGRSYIGVPSVSIEVRFAPIWESEEYKDYGYIETVEPCDIVTVIFERLGVDAKAKVEKTTYNVLLGRYDKVEIGDLKKTITNTIITQQKAIETVASDLTTTEQELVTNIENTAQEIYADVDEMLNGENGVYSYIDVKDGEIILEVGNVEDRLSSRIEVLPSSIDLSVTNGEDNASISLSITKEDGSTITTTAKTIKFTGDVIFASDLTDGTTQISGDNILTGTISADRINVDDLYVSRVGWTINTGGQGTTPTHIPALECYPNSLSAYAVCPWTFNRSITIGEGIILHGAAGQGINNIAGDAGFSGKIYANGGEYIVPGTNSGTNLVVSSAGNICADSSSRRWKHDISYDIPEDMDPRKLYDLKVATFVYNTDWISDATDEKYNTPTIGIIAEDVDEIYPQAAVHDQYGQCRDWSLKYLVPPMLALIQEQHEEIETLKTRLSRLEENI